MINASDRQAILFAFAREAAERCDELEGLLLELEDSPEATALTQQFMRAAHTLKGSAGVAGALGISELAHAIESVMQGLQSGRVRPDAAVFDRMARALAVIEQGLGAVRDGLPEPVSLGEAQRELLAWLQAHAAQTGAPTPAAAPVASFTLGEYDLVRLKVMREQKKELYELTLPAPPALANEEEAGAFISTVVRQARALGTVIVTEPALGDAAAVLGAVNVRVLLGTALDLTAVREQALACWGEAARCKPWSAPNVAGGMAANVEPGLVAERSVRVELADLDELLRLSGELMVSRDRLRHVARAIGERLAEPTLATEADDTATQLGQLTGQLQDAVMEARMVPVARLARVLKRGLRQASRGVGRPLATTQRGDDTELDKHLVDVLHAPLLRLADGLAKLYAEEFDSDPAVRLVMSAKRRWNRVVVTLESPLLARNTSELAAELEEALTVCSGTLDIRTENVDSPAWAMSLPLTMAIIRVMLCQVGTEVYAVALEAVRETLRCDTALLVKIKGSPAVELRGEPLSLLWLAELYDVPLPAPGGQHIIVISDGKNRLGVVVDRLIGIREVVQKPLGRRFAQLGFVSGASILGDGQIALILNADVVVQNALFAERPKERRATSQETVWT